jgi:hypothetical protein
MCFGGKSDTKPPAPQKPTTFDYSNQSGDSVARQAATYEAKGYENRANYGSDLTSGSPVAATPAAVPKPATTGGL